MDNNEIGKKVVARNELANDKPETTMEQFITLLSKVQDEAEAHKYQDVAALLHRALGKMQVYSLGKEKIERMEKKLGNDAT